MPELVPRRRIIDVRTNSLLLAATADTVLLLSESLEVLDQVGGTAQVAAFDPVSGCAFLVESSRPIQVVQVTPENTLRVLDSLDIPNIQGPIQARVVDQVLYILVERQQRVLMYDVSTPESPERLLDLPGVPYLYWERNPLAWATAEGQVLHVFSSLAWLSRDFPITAAEDTWALHGPIAAVSYEEA